MNAYTLGAMVANGTTVPQIVDYSLDPRIEKFSNRAGGSPDVSFVANRQSIPLVSFTTTAVKSILDLIGSLGVVAVGATVDLYLHQLAHGGSRTAGSTHLKLTVNDGLIVLRRISARHNQEATAQVDVIATYDGTNNPFTYTAAQALPASSLVAAEKFTAGDFKLGITLYDVQGIEIDTGIKEFVAGKSGEPYARFAAMMDREITITVDTLDATLITTVGVMGGAQSNATVFLKKIAENADRVAAITAEHISIACPTAYVYPGSARASQGSEAMAQIVVCPSDDGTNAPVTVDTTAAIA